MATRNEIHGLLLLQGKKPYDRITNQEAARLSDRYAPLREKLDRTKIARMKAESPNRTTQSLHRRMLRFKRFRCSAEKNNPFRWT